MENQEKTLTMKELAEMLKIPESTCRYYRDRFPGYIPTVGEGKKRRYKPEAADMLRLIALGFENNKTATEIEIELSRVYGIYTELEKVTQPTAAAQQQPVLEYFNHVNNILEMVTKHQAEHIRQLQEDNQAQAQQLNELQQRLEQLEQEEALEKVNELSFEYINLESDKESLKKKVEEMEKKLEEISQPKSIMEKLKGVFKRK